MPIHPLAVVDPQAEVHPDATVGPFCVVRGKAVLAAHVELRNNATVYGRATIGEGTVVFPGAVVGADPQDLKFKGEDSEVRVGARCRIHEAVTISKGTAGGGMLTSVGDGVLVMAYAHVAHDCRVGDAVVLGNCAQLAGHCTVERRAIVSGLVGCHHFVTIGELSIVGGMSGVRFDVPPFMMVEGNPAEPRSVNIIGLRRDGWAEADIDDIRSAFRDLWHDRGAKPLREAVEEVAESFEGKPQSPVHRLCDWLANHLDKAVKGRMGEAHRQAVVGAKANDGPTRQVRCQACAKDFPAQIRTERHMAACTHCGRQQWVEAQA